MSKQRKAIRIEIEYDDGTIEFAEGDAAAAIKGWYDGGEQMLCVHGGVYRGPKFQERKATA